MDYIRNKIFGRGGVVPQKNVNGIVHYTMTPKTLRTKHKLTQSQLAELLGVTSRTIRYWESGDLPKLAKLAMETVDRNLNGKG